MASVAPSKGQGQWYSLLPPTQVNSKNKLRKTFQVCNVLQYILILNTFFYIFNPLRAITHLSQHKIFDFKSKIEQLNAYSRSDMYSESSLYLLKNQYFMWLIDGN